VKRIKFAIALVFLAMMFADSASQSLAFPPFLPKAKKFGARDCRFCHATAEGGEPLSERGQWLVKEKERRGAQEVDPEWLADYKKGKPKKGK
jgi:hypothetical protein